MAIPYNCRARKTRRQRDARHRWKDRAIKLGDQIDACLSANKPPIYIEALRARQEYAQLQIAILKQKLGEVA